MIEVNASPSLSSTTVADRIMKYRLINDIINVVLPPDGVPDVKWNKIVSPDNYGFFELLLDEELATQTDPSSGEIIFMTKLIYSIYIYFCHFRWR